MPILYIHLLGDFHLLYGDQPVTGFNQPRLQSLLAYLLLHRHVPQSRRQLAFLFWPDTTDKQAQTNLRQLVHHLRHYLPRVDHYVSIDHATLQWRHDAPFTLDVAAFQTLCTQTEPAIGQATLARLEKAVALYAGELLPGCYDDWILPERERLRQQFAQAMERLIGELEDQRAYGAAIPHALRLLHHDPLHEASYRRLMQLHGLVGERAAALRVYHTCATTLLRELGVEPSQATRELYEGLLQTDGAPVTNKRPAARLTVATPLVGRQLEWHKLVAAWRLAAAGQAHFVLVAGEAGIGKTRLAEELAHWVGAQGQLTAHTRAYAAEGRLAYVPIADWLRNATLAAARQQLPVIWLSEVARILPEILIERPDLSLPGPLSESWQRKRLFEALARTLLAPAKPLLLVLDDLQWCDQETLEWLHFLLRFDPQARLLIVGTVRTEEATPDHALSTLVLALRAAEQLTEIAIGPLDAAETAALATAVAEQPLASAALTKLYAATEGNPLFIVEMVRTGQQEPRVESGDPSASPDLQSPISSLQSLPPKVQAVIQTRLAQLSPPALELTRLAATIGRSFTLPVLTQASGWDEETLVRHLDELWQRRIVREQGVQDYDFSHDRIREVAYQQIPPAQRRHLHGHVAQALEQVYAGELALVRAQIAVHCEEAGLVKQAIGHYQQAATAAHAKYAIHDTINYARRAVALLMTLPDSRARQEQELSLLAPLGHSLLALRGGSDEELEQLYWRTEQLSRQLGRKWELYLSQRNLWSSYSHTGRWRETREIAESLTTMAYQLQEPAMIEDACNQLALTKWLYGELEAAYADLAYPVTKPDNEGYQRFCQLSGFPPAINHIGTEASILWMLGYPDQARSRYAAGMIQARETRQGFSLAISLEFLAWIDYFLDSVAALQALADELIRLSTQYELMVFLECGLILSGWSLVRQGNSELGFARIQQGLTSMKRAGVYIEITWYLAVLAEAQLLAGYYAEALAVVDEAFAFAERIAEHFWQAELWRLRGELLWKTEHDAVAAASCYKQAIDIAHQQHAKALELRACMSLARLWQSQNMHTHAYQQLATVYAWFSEGFDTADLQAAKNLLAELAALID
ncbi:MAG: BTAD domain-containing putative transcriptional regulator [Anaerolineae bacterium]